MQQLPGIPGLRLDILAISTFAATKSSGSWCCSKFGEGLCRAHFKRMLTSRHGTFHSRDLLDMQPTRDHPHCENTDSWKPLYLRWIPELVIVTLRDNKDYIRVLLYSCSITLQGGGGPPNLDIGSASCRTLQQKLASLTRSTGARRTT